MTSYNAPRGIATLLIDNARVNDIGNYTCVVSNPAGTEKSEPNLLILKGPQEESGPKQHTLIVNPLEDQECFESETVMFVRDLTGNLKQKVDFCDFICCSANLLLICF